MLNDLQVPPAVPEDKFIDAVKQVVNANEEYVPPYGTGATLYLRPYLIGVGPSIKDRSAPEYIFGVFLYASWAVFLRWISTKQFHCFRI